MMAQLLRGAVAVHVALLLGNDAGYGEDSTKGKNANPLTAGQKLYAQHCAGCHGNTGEGNGPAATFLFPKPRNFRFGKYRLVSTENQVPNLADLESLLVRGMPGSSMPSWAHLKLEERKLLAQEVYRLTGVGARDRYLDNLKKEQGLTDEDIKADDVQQEIAEFVKSRTTPSEAAVVPAILASNAEAIARGKELFVKQACASCHGNEGKGDGVKKMVDDEGFPTRPRDLTRGIYKGGHDPASLFLRIARGMPGTPMPSAPALNEAQVVDLIHFLRSLSAEEQRQSVVLARKSLIARRLGQLPKALTDTDWASIPATKVQTVPLWWRDDAELNFSVQAAHDGQTLAIRLGWTDAIANTSAVVQDEFEDMAAVQLYRGSAEPFLGMGATEGVTDLWLWRGGRSAAGEERSLLDDYPFDAQVYRDQAKAKGQTVPNYYITGRAAGNQVSIRDTSAQELGAKGPGSSTFAPRPSQAVIAEAVWKDAHWTVVLKRPLAAPESGLSLASGDRCSVAFALWDGAFRDRGGQKLISIWNDLKVE